MIDLSYIEFKPNFQMPLQDQKYQSQPNESKFWPQHDSSMRACSKVIKQPLKNK